MDIIALLKIVWIDVLLSGDNAVVIALACHGLPPNKRLLGMVFGATAAVLLRIMLTGTLSVFLNLPMIRIAGGAMLVYIAIGLLSVKDDNALDIDNSATRLGTAIWTILVADVTMSIDNILAVAAAAKGNVVLLGIGLALSIPLIVTGAAVISKVIDKFPLLTWAGAGLLGWIAGENIASELGLTDIFIPSLSMLLVLLGALLMRRIQHQRLQREKAVHVEFPARHL